jgi:hypothetical protein
MKCSPRRDGSLVPLTKGTEMLLIRAEAALRAGGEHDSELRAWHFAGDGRGLGRWFCPSPRLASGPGTEMRHLQDNAAGQTPHLAIVRVAPDRTDRTRIFREREQDIRGAGRTCV